MTCWNCGHDIGLHTPFGCEHPGPEAWHTASDGQTTYTIAAPEQAAVNCRCSLSRRSASTRLTDTPPK